MPRVEAGRGAARATRAASPAAPAGSHAPARAFETGCAREWLTFRSGTEEYGLDNAFVREIRAYGLPARGDAVIAGIAIVQGAVLPIADLRTRGEPARMEASLTSTLVLEIDGQRVGVAVGAVGEVVRLRAEDILPPPSFPRGRDTAHVVGIAAPDPGDRRRTIVLVDIRRWLAARFVSPR